MVNRPIAARPRRQLLYTAFLSAGSNRRSASLFSFQSRARPAALAHVGFWLRTSGSGADGSIMAINVCRGVAARSALPSPGAIPAQGEDHGNVAERMDLIAQKKTADHQSHDPWNM